MKRKSDKTRKREREAEPFREHLRRSVGRCECCGRKQERPEVHEISRGPYRQKSLDQPFAVLVLCRWCHEEFGDAAIWPEARQLALLAERRLPDWDLEAYLRLKSPRAPKRIELSEVTAYMSKELLKVEQVAERMQVNRRTVQSWIDSGQLAAVDVRPAGADRAMWRVDVTDLLTFAQARKRLTAQS